MAWLLVASAMAAGAGTIAVLLARVERVRIQSVSDDDAVRATVRRGETTA